MLGCVESFRAVVRYGGVCARGRGRGRMTG